MLRLTDKLVYNATGTVKRYYFKYRMTRYVNNHGLDSIESVDYIIGRSAGVKP